MIKINIIFNNNKWHKYLKDPETYIQKQVFHLNKKFKLYKKKDIFCTLLLSGDKEIRKLNKKFRKKNKSTDVLSFPFYVKNELKKIKNKTPPPNFKIEFNKLWIHGLTHLFGYDHKKDKDFYKMKNVERKFLSFLK